jgi:hypothetical protein
MNEFIAEIEQATARIANMIGEGAYVYVKFLDDRNSDRKWSANAARFVPLDEQEEGEDRRRCEHIAVIYCSNGPLEALKKLTKVVSERMEAA